MKIRQKVSRKMKTAAKFATDDFRTTTPLALRSPHSRNAWAKLSEADRLAHIRGVIEAEVRASLAEKTPAPASEKAPSPVPASAPAPAEEAPAQPEEDTAKPSTASRWLVPCIGCGAFLPARSGKPVVARCTDHRATGIVEREPRPALELSTARLISRYRHEAAIASADRGEATPKPKKKRRGARRAVCVNSPKAVDFV